MSYLPSRRYLVVLVIFFATLAASGGWLLIRANGYRIFWSPLRLVKTGVISLQVYPADKVTIALNGVEQPAGRHDFPDLAPGRYTIAVARVGMMTWEETAVLAAGQALRFEDIVLFYTEPAGQTIETTDRSSFEKALERTAALTTDLQIINGEIWNGDTLVTRFSEPVSQAVWRPGKTHLFIQVGNAIRVMDASGRHDQALVRLSPEAKAVRYVPISGGAELVVDVDGAMTIHQITEPFGLLPALQRLRSGVE